MIRNGLKSNADDKKGLAGKPVKRNLTDHDSALMKRGHGVIQGYTGVAAVDDRHQVVVDAEAFGTGQEQALLPEVLAQTGQHFQALGPPEALKPATVTADAGYHREGTLEKLAEQGIDGYVADTNFRKRDPRFAEAYQHQPEEKRRPPASAARRGFRPGILISTWTP